MKKKSKVGKLFPRKRLRAVKGGLAKLTRLTTHHDSSKATAHSKSTQANDHLNDNNSGVLRQDSAQLRLPTALADAGDSEADGLMPSGLALFIIFAAAVFIAMIAWRISEMPAGK